MTFNTITNAAYNMLFILCIRVTNDVFDTQRVEQAEATGRSNDVWKEVRIGGQTFFVDKRFQRLTLNGEAE